MSMSRYSAAMLCGIRNVGIRSRLSAFRLQIQFNRACHVNRDTQETHVVDLRSDVLTRPTPAMRQAMAEATLGDDVFNEDPTIHKLQKKVADMFEMEDALFTPSGTMANLIAVCCHCFGRGEEMIVGDKSHLIMYEQGGLAHVGAIHPRTIPNLPDGSFDLDLLDFYIRPRDDPHQPWTTLIAIENTHNNCGGKVLSLDFLSQLRKKANKYGIPVHLDGARVLNAAAALDVSPSEISQYVDSTTLCFSKCVGTPVGSVVVGTKSLIARALRMRKMLGGGMRQPGFLAAASLVGLEDAIPRMKQDHTNALQMAKAIMEKGQGVVNIDLEGVHSNMVMIDVIKEGLTAADICERMAKVTGQEENDLGEKIIVKLSPTYKQTVRLVTYSSLVKDDCLYTVKKFNYVLDELAAL